MADIKLITSCITILWENLSRVSNNLINPQEVVVLFYQNLNLLIEIIH